MQKRIISVRYLEVAQIYQLKQLMQGLYLTHEEAEEKLDQWKGAFPQLIGWQRDQEIALVPSTLDGQTSLLTKGPNGSDKYTTRLNTQVQGTGGDCMKAALALLWEKYPFCQPRMATCCKCSR